jgi:hypothetical protein
MIKIKSMKNIREIEIEMTRMMNIQLIVYKIALIIEMTERIWENEIELFLIDDYKKFLIMKINECRNFLMNEKFSESLIDMKMKMIVWVNFLLLMTRETDVSLMIAKVIVLSLIDLEMTIFEWMIFEILLILMILIVLIL